MNTNQQADTPETSVMFSLAELADIEEERVKEEADHRAARLRTEEQAEQERKQAERDAEQARVAAEIERRTEVEREKAEAEAREVARERATVEVARIEAESRARLAAQNAERDHELKVLRVKSDGGRTRLRHALAGIVGLLLLGGSAAAWAVNGHIGELERESQHLREDRWAIAQAHDQALTAELVALDSRHAALLARGPGKLSEQARVRAAAARSAIEAGGTEAPQLRAFSSTLDALAGRLAVEARVAEGDRRFADLSRWAHAQGKSKLLGDARKAAAGAHAAAADEASAKAYAKSLDALATALSSSDKIAVRRGPVSVSKDDPKPVTGPVCTNPHDPMCGLDGQTLRTK